jgi:hypothetical protein
MGPSVIEFLQANGEKMEAEIAKALHVPILVLQEQLAQLKSAGEVICCKVTRFAGGKTIEGISYRLSRAKSGKPIPPPTISKSR